MNKRSTIARALVDERVYSAFSYLYFFFFFFFFVVFFFQSFNICESLKKRARAVNASRGVWTAN